MRPSPFQISDETTTRPFSRSASSVPVNSLAMPCKLVLEDRPAGGVCHFRRHWMVKLVSGGGNGMWSVSVLPPS